MAPRLPSRESIRAPPPFVSFSSTAVRRHRRTANLLVTAAKREKGAHDSTTQLRCLTVQKSGIYMYYIRLIIT